MFYCLLVQSTGVLVFDEGLKNIPKNQDEGVKCYSVFEDVIIFTIEVTIYYSMQTEGLFVVEGFYVTESEGSRSRMSGG
jgi:hypothetical protein